MILNTRLTCYFLLLLLTIILMIQKLYGEEYHLKVLQTMFSSIGNGLLIFYLTKTKLKPEGQVLISLVLCSIIMAVITLQNINFLVYGVWPLINTISLSLALAYNAKLPDHVSARIDGILYIILTIFFFISMFAILHEMFVKGQYRFEFSRSVGLLFKPSSAAFTMCFITILIFRNLMVRLFLVGFYIFAFKAMSALLIQVLLVLLPMYNALRLRGRLFLLVLAPIVGVLAIYISDLVYNRYLWISVFTRIGLILEFDVYGNGIGFGTNIILNATDEFSRVSDGLINFMKNQYGVFGLIWFGFILYFALIISIKGRLILGGAICISFVAFNIPEVAFLNLLYPTILIFGYKV